MLLTACAPEPSLVARVDLGLARAADALAERQSKDGAWRSTTYGALKDGWTLTGPCAKVLLFAPNVPSHGEAVRRALEHLTTAASADPAARGVAAIDAGPTGLPYPVYTASLAAIVLARGGGEARAAARDAWLELLRAHQLAEGLGWSATDLAYGGFGYSILPPRRPAENGAARPTFDADLSSTVFALGALRIAGAPAADPAVQRALRFVERCQNLAPDGAVREPALDDGGFCLTPTNAHQNKAGVAGVDADGRTRYRSYGTATADGLRALLRCGLPPEHPRVVAAFRWLERRFDAGRMPGELPPERESERDALFYYWCWSVAHALHAYGVSVLEAPAGRVHWPTALAEALLPRQSSDGTWRSTHSLVKEDDPLVATSLACGALGVARLRLPALE